MSWPVIIGLMVATALVTGLALGFFSEKLGFHPGAGVGAARVVGDLLLARQKSPPS